ncbi:MAG: DUF932 domain-containing protein [Paracoccaceae bacterium]|nr:DUF932 domain-containing protein [Paracoccaceae bacterium]
MDQDWEDALHNACFPVALADVYVGDSTQRAIRYRAIVPRGGGEPFAIVTDRYRLVSNEDVIDLGHEAFERLFGPYRHARMEVFNVVMARSRGSFFADFTVPELDCSISIPSNGGSAEQKDDPTGHTFFLRVVNSYNRTQAVRLEVGVCRWICRNGMIFGKQSIRLRDSHHKSKRQLMDQIARHAEFLSTVELRDSISAAYGLSLAQDMTVLEGVWQILRLAIPPMDPKSRTAGLWRNRCHALRAVSGEYQKQFGKTVFSVLQAASQWAREQAQTSPIQRHSYERRCGEMLESLMTSRQWPGRKEEAKEQIERIHSWANTAPP